VYKEEYMLFVSKILFEVSEARTVRNGPVISFFIVSVDGEGIGNACEIWLDQSVRDRIVETL